MRGNESLDLLSQSGIASAGLLQEGSPLAGFALHGCLKQVLDSLPTFRSHKTSDEWGVMSDEITDALVFYTSHSASSVMSCVGTPYVFYSPAARTTWAYRCWLTQKSAFAIKASSTGLTAGIQP